MDENKNGVSMSKRGAVWYTILSFLFVTFLIFLAVMITYSAAVKRIGATYAKQLALASKGFEESEVSDLDALRTYYNGKTVFEVTFNKDDLRHIVYIDSETAEIAQKTTGGTPDGTQGISEGIMTE